MRVPREFYENVEAMYKRRYGPEATSGCLSREPCTGTSGAALLTAALNDNSAPWNEGTTNGRKNLSDAAMRRACATAPFLRTSKDDRSDEDDDGDQIRRHDRVYEDPAARPRRGTSTRDAVLRDYVSEAAREIATRAFVMRPPDGPTRGVRAFSASAAEARRREDDEWVFRERRGREAAWDDDEDDGDVYDADVNDDGAYGDGEGVEFGCEAAVRRVAAEAIKAALAAGRGADARRRWNAAGKVARAAAAFVPRGKRAEGDASGNRAEDGAASRARHPGRSRSRWKAAVNAAVFVSKGAREEDLSEVNLSTDEGGDDGDDDDDVASFHSFGQIISARRVAWRRKLRAHQAYALAGGSLASNAFTYDRGPRAVHVHSRAVALHDRRYQTNAHRAALRSIQVSGKSRHGRVDNATPRAMGFARVRVEGLRRRRARETEARERADPAMARLLERAARVGSSGLRLAEVEEPPARHASIKTTKTKGGSRPGWDDSCVSRGPTGAKSAWEDESKRMAYTSDGSAAAKKNDAKNSEKSRRRLLPGGLGAIVDDPGHPRDRRAGGHAEAHKAARKRREAEAIAARNREMFERIASAKPHYPASAARSHAARHRSWLEMHHEAAGGLPDMTSDLARQRQPPFVDPGRGPYTLQDKRRGGGGCAGDGTVPAPWHRGTGAGVEERYVEFVARAPAVAVPPWLDGTGMGADDEGMAARLFRKNFMSEDSRRGWKD